MNLETEWKRRWPYFQPREIFGDEQYKLFTQKGVIPYSFRALDKLCKFREYLNAPIIVNVGEQRHRGARSVREVYHVNKKTRPVGQEWGYSFHLWCAFDIIAPPHSPLVLYGLALKSGLWGGVGLYKTFVHVDDRDHFGTEPTTWDMR